ncbi:hypothetical protein HaLaN_25021, partial [Haematococcus lacustris]
MRPPRMLLGIALPVSTDTLLPGGKPDACQVLSWVKEPAQLAAPVHGHSMLSTLARQGWKARLPLHVNGGNETRFCKSGHCGLE